MSSLDPSGTVTVAVPFTLYVTVAVPQRGASDKQALADAIALKAAEHFARVSEAQIRSFNEMNRLQPEIAGAIQSVTSGNHLLLWPEYSVPVAPV